MREVDTDTPVVWPAWCYSGEAAIDDSTPQASSSPLLANTAQTASAPAFRGNTKTKRKHHQPHQQQQQQQQQQRHQQQSPVPPQFTISASYSMPLEKMISDRMMSFADANNKKHCDTSKNSYYDQIKSETNGELTLNNNNVKNERLSPMNGNAQMSNSRSRSVTPSSYPGTPPQQLMPNEVMAQNLAAGSLQHNLQPRNYSDFMRSLAAKYNNTNHNEFTGNGSGTNSSISVNASLKKEATKESPSPPSAQQQLTSVSPQVPTPNNILMSSILNNMSFGPTVFNPLIDMSSTQALVTLARAAKEAQVQHLLKNVASSSTPVYQQQQQRKRSHAQTTARSSMPACFSPPSPAGTSSSFSVANLNNSPASTAATSSSDPNTSATTPLDLSAAPNAKKMKIESPSPTRHSPTTTTTPKSSSFGNATNHITVSIGAGTPTNSASLKSPATPPTGDGHQQLQQQQQQQTSIIKQERKCHAQEDEIQSWSVEQVCEFVSGIDLCAEYVTIFREQSIDGSGLPMLTEEHLTNLLGMKLGPALKLKSILARRLGGPCPCISCNNNANGATISSAHSSSSSSSSSTSSSLSSLAQSATSTAASPLSSAPNNIPRPASADSGS